MDFGDGVGDNWHAACGGFYGSVAACEHEIPAFAGMVYLVYGKLCVDLVTVLATAGILWIWQLAATMQQCGLAY